VDLTQTQINELRELIGMPGWKIYVRLLFERLDAAKITEHKAKDFEHFLEARGEVNAIERVARLIQDELEEE
jgi:hypothetical protein